MKATLRLAFCVWGTLLATTAEGSTPPNIVVILADDLGYGDLGCYNTDSKIPTPHLDQLAASGMRFTDAHSSSSVCTPTRYALLTGRYAWRTRLQRGVMGPWSPPLISAKQLTVAALLKQHGYPSRSGAGNDGTSAKVHLQRPKHTRGHASERCPRDLG